MSLSDPDENLSGYEADVSSTLLSEDLVSDDILNIPLLLPISQRKPISKQQREYLIEGKSSSDSCQVSITAQAGDSFSRYEDSLEEELSQQLLTAQPRSSTPIITDKVVPLQLPTEMTDSDNPSPKCDAPPPSPVDSDSAEKRVLLIGTIDKIHKQITEAQATQTNEVIVNHSKERKSEIHLTFPIKIEETNQHGLIQYPTDKLLLEQEKNPVISKQDIAEQNKLISETIESIRYPDLNDELRSELKTVLKTHRRAISFKGELGVVKNVAVRLMFQPHSPIFAQQIWPTSPKEQEYLQYHLDKLEDAGVIARMNSLYSHPTFLVRKPGTKTKTLKDLTPKDFRFVSDVRLLNAVAVVNPSPIPLLNQLLAGITIPRKGAGTVMSTLDLRSGFYQVLLTPDSWIYTGFKRNGKSYAYRRLPQGLRVSPYIFQSLLTYVLADLKDIRVISFLDDCLLVSESVEQHIKDLGRLLKRFEEVNMKFSLDKMFLCNSEVDFMGFHLVNGMIMPQSQKLKLIRELQPPKTLRQTRRILGILNYYRRFVKHFAKKAAPITALTRKGQEIVWTEECDAALSALKESLNVSEGLVIPDFTKEWLVFTDESDIALGATLLQAQKGKMKEVQPVAFDSRLLLPAEQKYVILDKELLAIAFALDQYKMYLQWEQFHILTDSSVAVAMLKSTNHSGRSNKMLRILCYIKSYTFSISYVKSEDNISDFLTRDLLPKEVPQMETYDEIFSSDYDKYVLLHQLNKSQEAEEQLNDEDMLEHYTWEEHPLRILALSQKIREPHWLQEDPIEEEEFETYEIENEPYLEQLDGYSVKITTQRQERLKDIQNKMSQDSNRDDPQLSDDGHAPDNIKTPKQGPIGIQQIFPYPDFDPLDEESFDPSSDAKITNLVTKHKRFLIWNHLYFPQSS